MAQFDPKPNDELALFGEVYWVQAHPSAPHIAYSSYAGRATVYQLRRQDGEYFALKVFRNQYRSAYLTGSADHLRKVESLAGLQAAQRRFIPPDDPNAQHYRNLAYAMLMPWIQGKTWYDMLEEAAKGEYLPVNTALHLCNQFLVTMAGLERAGVAHTDLSPGNVVIDLDKLSIQLLDLEDMYLPGVRRPPQPSRGSNGYRHYRGDAGEDCWRPEGDRYAAAVMAAEILILAHSELAHRASDEGYFTNHYFSVTGAERYKAAEGWLKQVAPDFAKAFKRAWIASTLKHCPRIGELEILLRYQTSSTPRESTMPIVLSSASDHAVKVARRIRWEPWDKDELGGIAEYQEKAKHAVEWIEQRTRAIPWADMMTDLGAKTKDLEQVVSKVKTLLAQLVQRMTTKP